MVPRVSTGVEFDRNGRVAGDCPDGHSVKTTDDLGVNQMNAISLDNPLELIVRSKGFASSHHELQNPLPFLLGDLQVRPGRTDFL